jgi:hypothetical protein
MSHEFSRKRGMPNFNWIKIAVEGFGPHMVAQAMETLCLHQPSASQ